MRKVLLMPVLLLAGCAVGPDYQRPAVPAPPRFRGDVPPDTKVSLADTKWPELFGDETLTGLIRSALEQNYDLRIASQRVLEFRAQLGINRSYLFPTVSGSGQVIMVRNSQIGAQRLPPGLQTSATATQLGFGLSWELDVWGRIRRLTEAAQAQYEASEENRHGVMTTLVADVATTYFRLRELDLELEIAEKTRTIAENSLRLIRARHDRGAATGLDIHQAEQFLYTATAQIASIERSREQTENALRFLMARNPGDIPRGMALEAIAAPALVPAGLPSALLERRPDIRAAERSLIAANAQIGAAKAQYFPQISLTGLLGAQSRALADLFTGPGRQWSFTPAAMAPIFNAGRLRANVRLTEALQQEALVSYEKAIQNGFREVSDALVGYRKTVEQRSQQELLVEALRESTRLSRLRYQGGLDSYLQVLDADRNLFQGELLLAQLRREELLSIVQLYRALGGGWQ